MDVVPLAKARELAQGAGLDLVLVSDRSTPPVVRIMNFGKLQYEQKKNLKTQRKNSAAQKLKENFTSISTVTIMRQRSSMRLTFWEKGVD